MKLLRAKLKSRRSILYLGMGAAILPFVSAMRKSNRLSEAIYAVELAIADAPMSKQRKFTIVGKGSLQQRARAKGLIYGAFPQANDLEFASDLAFQAQFVRECTMMTVGCYWVVSRPGVSTFDFTAIDYFTKFSQQHKLRLRAHPLVWHEALPQWVNETVNSTNAERVLTEHIQTLLQRYAGKMHSWDVVNEAIDVGNGRTRADGLRDTLWLKYLGQDYINLAFRLAAKSDPHTKLVYNDYGVEYDTPEAGAKREAILNLLQRLKAQGTPIYALGIQSHLVANKYRFDSAKFRDFLSSVAKLGLKIMITELDVIDKHSPLDLAVRDRLVASMYEDYLNTALAEPAVISVTTWGLSDRYSWLTTSSPRDDKAPVRPLPLDLNFQPKLAWNALARSLDRAPKRRLG